MRKLKYPALALALAVTGTALFFFLHGTPPEKKYAPTPSQTGYETQARLQMEQLIHEGTKDD